MSEKRQHKQESCQQCLSPLPLAIIVLALILIPGTPAAAIVTPAASIPFAITVIKAPFLLPLRLPLLSHSTV
jgi:hypothetical protein